VRTEFERHVKLFLYNIGPRQTNRRTDALISRYAQL